MVTVQDMSVRIPKSDGQSNGFRRAGALGGVNPKDSCDDVASATEVDADVAAEWGTPVTSRGRSIWVPRFLMGRDRLSGMSL